MTMASIALSPARALRRPRRLDMRAIFGLFLLLVAVIGSVAFWSASASTTTVLEATRDLPAGAMVTSADLAIARVRVDDATYQAAVPAGELSTVVGKQLTDPLHAHQILARAQLSSHLPLSKNQMVLTIPVNADTAAGGHVRAGDVVEVLVTTGKDTPAPRTHVVLPRVAVYDVGHDQSLTTVSTNSSTSSAPGSVSSLTLIVTQQQALALAQAKWAGQLDVALRPGR
jgi:pilus assembly protein CpaB